MEVAARLAAIDPADVVVELVLDGDRTERKRGMPAPPDNGRLAGNPAPEENAVVERLAFESGGDIAATGEHRFRLRMQPERCGRLSYRVRMYPHHSLLSQRFETGLMIWLS